ncbi:MAG: transporter substrate-binding domain-containing protein [Paracoccaceae bacterium]
MTDATKLIREFAPTGRLRVALNHGNRVLVGRDDKDQPFGISVDLARDLAAHLGLALDFVEYERAVDVSSSATSGVWDVCFLAVDPERAKTIAFTAPYVRIEGCYLAGAGCKAADAGELVALGLPVGSVKGSAYSLTLQRKPGAENLVMFEDIFAALAALDRGEVEAIAGIRQAMEGEAEKRPGSRVLQPPFMEIRQAMAMPQGRPAASAALADFLAEALRSGRVGDILQSHGVARDCAILQG